MKKIAIIVLALVVFGCVNEVTRDLIKQAELAGKKVKEESNQPELARAGADVEANMKVVLAAVKEPKNPALEYSQAECARLRQRQIELIERANWWKDFATNGITALLSLIGLSLPPIVSKWVSWRRKAISVYEGLENVWDKIPEPMVELIKTKLREASQSPKYGGKKNNDAIKVDLKKMRG